MTLKAVITIQEDETDPEVVTANVQFSSTVSLEDMNEHPVARAASIMMNAIMKDGYGEITNVEIGNRALTQDQIRAIKETHLIEEPDAHNSNPV